MKNLFNPDRLRLTARQLAALHPRFNAAAFLALALRDLETLELMDRLRRTAEAFDRALPLPFAEQVAVLLAHAPQIGHSFVAIWPCEHVARRGLEQPALALPALRALTRHGSAEFALRPFLASDLTATLAVLIGWTTSPDEHVRRLASEGSRPRLPWGQSLRALITDPSPTLPLLTTLRADPCLYVRKSVANHLNDITKDHPGIVLDLVAGWDRRDARTAWIVRHALRTLVKKGHPRALALLGVGAAPRLAATLTVAPAQIQLGDAVTFSVQLASTSARAQSLAVDYAVHYVRPSGRTSVKVFKWTTLTLAPGETTTLTKRQTIRDFSTRRHHPGVHRVELQINGRRLPGTRFTLLA